MTREATSECFEAVSARPDYLRGLLFPSPFHAGSSSTHHLLWNITSSMPPALCTHSFLCLLCPPSPSPFSDGLAYSYLLLKMQTINGCFQSTKSIHYSKFEIYGRVNQFCWFQLIREVWLFWVLNCSPRSVSSPPPSPPFPALEEAWLVFQVSLLSSGQRTSTGSS